MRITERVTDVRVSHEVSWTYRSVTDTHHTSTSTYFHTLLHIERGRNCSRSEAREARDDGQPEVRRGRPRTLDPELRS